VKRTPLRNRSRPLVRRSGLPSVSASQRHRNARYAAARAIVVARDGGVCQRCGAPGTDCHHRAGRVGARMWQVDLLVLLCAGCHTAVHANPVESYADGWMVRRVT
jgi:5-methylcytosine-specific restriction endonuclease McrA